jgi:hypothetical protein
MTYLTACQLLNIHPGRGLENAKRRARFALDTFSPDAPLRYKAAATLILRTTPAQALAAFQA